MVTKAQVKAVIERGQAEMVRFAEQLKPEEKVASGTPQQWGGRDVVAHMAFWNLRLAERIAAARSGSPLGQGGDSPLTNEIVYERYRTCTWDEIRALVDQAGRAMLAQLDALNEEQLNQPQGLPGFRARPLWKEIIGSGFMHPMSHIGTAYLERGQRDYIEAVRQDEVRLVTGLDDSPSWQAGAQYNLACHYALAGDKAKALHLLEVYLPDAPELIDWALQDSDLVSLHGDPDFLGLIEHLRKIG